MKISLIVCTRDRAARLSPFFDALRRIDRPPFEWELVLVDHASADDTSVRLREFASSVDFQVRPLRVDSHSLSEAKNQAASRAGGEILAFTDDDCYPRPDYLMQLAGVFDAHPVGVVGGRVDLFDPTDARVSIRDAADAVSIAPETFVPAGIMHGANLAIRREVFQAIGGFDRLLGPGTACVAAEDIDLIARAVWSGCSARYDPAPAVAHHHGRKPGPDTERVRRGYDRGRGAYYTKFLLRPPARRLYLRKWWETTRRVKGAAGRRRLMREVAGGATYLLQRLRRDRPVASERRSAEAS